jgi:hypothetical protein
LVWLGFSGDGASLVGVGAERTLMRWETSSGRLTAAYKGAASPDAVPAVSPDGRRVALRSPQGRIFLANLMNATPSESVRFGGGMVTSLAFVPNSDSVLAGTDHGAIAICPLGAPPNPRPVKVGSVTVESLGFADNGELLIGDGSGYVNRWDWKGGV